MSIKVANELWICCATDRTNGVWASAGFDPWITFPKETSWDSVRIYRPSSSVLTMKSKEVCQDAGSKDGTTNDCSNFRHFQ